MLIDIAKIHTFCLANSLLDSPMATCMANHNGNPGACVEEDYLYRAKSQSAPHMSLLQLPKCALT